jgi:2-polyprenyl-6-hydroxyphenyl methylase/3-demethylubiquinone-9 3-methyltransferase
MAGGNISRVAIGPAIRKTLRTHPQIQSRISNIYRSIFIDINGLVEHLPIPASATSLLNIGTGDGSVLNLIAHRFPSVKITTADISRSRGELIDDEVSRQIHMVDYLPNDFSAEFWRETFDVVLLIDVIHHVHTDNRLSLLRHAWAAVAPGGLLLVKEVEPRGIRALLGRLSDKYLTGDRHAEFISSADLCELLTESSPGGRIHHSDLVNRDFPNYLLIAQRS